MQTVNAADIYNWASDLVYKNSETLLTPENMTCTTCKGTGKVDWITCCYLKTTTKGPCVACLGEGIHSESYYLRAIISITCQCNCPKRGEMYYFVSDGMEVFGKNTYVCANCNKVYKFTS